MRRFTIEDYKRLERTDRLAEELNKYEGVLPMLLLPFTVYSEYENNLKRLPNYKEIREEYYNIRRDYLKSRKRDTFREDQLMRWVEENPSYEKVLLDSIQ